MHPSLESPLLREWRTFRGLERAFDLTHGNASDPIGEALVKSGDKVLELDYTSPKEAIAHVDVMLYQFEVWNATSEGFRSIRRAREGLRRAIDSD